AVPRVFGKFEMRQLSVTARVIKALRGCPDQSMGFRFCRCDRSLRPGNFEQPRQLLKRRSQCGPQSVDRALGPDILEDQPSDDEAKENSNDAIADVIEIGVGCVTLEDAVEKSER